MMVAVRRLLQGVFPVVLFVRKCVRLIIRPITVGVRALVIENDQVLLVRMHASDQWELPGGGVKRGESLRKAAEREAREETGCRVRAERLLGVYFSLHEGMSNHVAVFVCHPLSPPTNTLNIEIAEARYWPIGALPPHAAGTLSRRLAEYLSGAQGIDGMW